MVDQRRDPDKILQKAQAEERKEQFGKLKIYLGAAPGVGKTHTMLVDSLEAHKAGLDVVVGIAESHGRAEINALLSNFEILPRKEVEYHGTLLQEFDLDAALQRHPGLILIDEMAHTNAPGSRHKKRWQDIKELLDRGIDVYTTLNVQHIESLNDDVAQIIHAPILETVPDSILELADTIELVDIPPDELLKRLHEGKVYIPAQAAIASEHFFRKGNLIALRELALRVTAERVGEEVLLYRQGEGIQHIWPTNEKIMVIVGSSADSRKLIRRARRIAASLQADWICVHVDRPHLRLNPRMRELAINNLRFAERLGAETRILSGFDIVGELMSFARSQNVTQIMIYKHIRNRFINFFFKDLPDEIVRYSGEIDVYVMTGSAIKKEETPELAKQREKGAIDWKSYGISIAAVGLATFFNLMIHPHFANSNIAMVYLLTITLVSLMGRMGPSLLATLLSVLAFDFFFLPSIHSFSLADFQYLFTLFVMLIIGQVISQLTMLTRRQAASASRTANVASTLYTLSRQLASTRGTDKLLNAGVHFLSHLYDAEVCALLPTDDHLEIRSCTGATHELDDKESGIAEWVYELGQMAGVGTDSLSFSKALYLPMQGTHQVLGVLRILPNDPERLAEPEQQHLLEACATQIALALEVDQLQESSLASEIKLQTDQVRSTLMKSVSHDLRTPIRLIMGAATTEIEMGGKIDPHTIHKIAEGIFIEAEQLDRLINNLLQITYFESENIHLRKKLGSIKELLLVVLKISSHKLHQRKVNLSVPDNLPLVPFDNTLMQEVLFNLIDNAVKFTPDDSPIDFSVDQSSREVIVSVIDHGPGIMVDEVNHLFEKFYRGRRLTEARGLGLGLAICHAIIQAHGGRIWAENGPTEGAIFRFTLPIEEEILAK